MKVHIGKYPKKEGVERIERVKIDDFDLWNLDSTLALIIHPALVKFKEELDGPFAGIPTSFFEELPSVELSEEENNARDDKAMNEWKAILDKMIWSFSEIANGHPLEARYFNFEDAEDGRVFDAEGYKAYQDRIQEGVELFGKHFQSLWT